MTKVSQSYRPIYTKATSYLSYKTFLQFSVKSMKRSESMAVMSYLRLLSEEFFSREVLSGISDRKVALENLQMSPPLSL